MRIGWLIVIACGAGCSKEFEDYRNKSMAIEAKVNLQRLDHALVEYALEHGSLPTGHAELTPAEDCCTQPGHRCSADPAPWQAEPWRTLDFSLFDAPRFRYDFDSDGTVVTAHAVADLECNGHPVTYTLRAELADGVVKATLDDPVRGKPPAPL